MLFSVCSNSEPFEHGAQALSAVEQQGLFVSSAQEYLRKHFVNIDFSELQGRALHWSSNGRWGFHDLIVFLLKQTGPAFVSVSSFTISVAAANAFIKLQDAHYLRGCRIFVNSGKKNDMRKALTVLGDRFEVCFAPVHAKICVLKNDDFAFSVLSSGNLSSGGNKERGVIFTDPQIIKFDEQFLESLYQ